MVVSLTEKMIRKCFGGKEKKKTAKKSNFKTKVLSAFFEALWVGKLECVWVGVCVRVIRAKKRKFIKNET